jgi:TolA-binding protein
MRGSYIKMLELLSKDELSPEEQSLLDNLIENDKEALSGYALYNQVKNVVRHSSHISDGDIANYILYKQNINPGRNFLQPDLELIENHLNECERCSTAFKELSHEYENIDSLLNVPASASSAKLKQNRFQFSFKTRFIKYAFASGLATAVLCISLILISSLSTPQTIELAKVNNNSLFYVTRGRESSQFQRGLNFLGNKDYQDAAKSFEQDIRTNNNPETIFYAHYILGLTYLASSSKSFLGLFPSYDKEKVDEAIKNFNDCIAENTSGRFLDITLNSYFYMAKANLALGKKDAAKKYFEMVIDGKGSKMDDANKLLEEL